MSLLSTQRLSRCARHFALLPVAAALAFSMPAAPAYALTDVLDGFTHTLGCAGLLISDPARHLAECGVGEGFQDRSQYPYHHIFETDGRPSAPEVIVIDCRDLLLNDAARDFEIVLGNEPVLFAAPCPDPR